MDLIWNILRCYKYKKNEICLKYNTYKLLNINFIYYG